MVEFITLSTNQDNQLIVDTSEPQAELVYATQDRETGTGMAVFCDSHGRYVVEEFGSDFGHFSPM
jgi:hypothetical protein